MECSTKLNLLLYLGVVLLSYFYRNNLLQPQLQFNHFWQNYFLLCRLKTPKLMNVPEYFMNVY